MVKFTLPELAGDQWLTSIHTNDPESSERSTLKTGDAYKVTGCSLLLTRDADEWRTCKGDLASRARSIGRGSAADLKSQCAGDFPGDTGPQSTRCPVGPRSNSHSQARKECMLNGELKPLI